MSESSEQTITPGLKQIEKFLGVTEVFLLTVFLFLLLGLTFSQMVLRYFDTAITWSDVVARHVNLWLACAGAMLATHQKRHLQVDIASRVIPKKYKFVWEFFINAACIVIAVLLYKATFKYVMMVKTTGFTLWGDVPQWYFVLMMPICFGVVAIHCIIHMMDLLFRIMTGK